MLNKLQYKIVAVFVILVVTISIVMSAFLSTNIINFYNRDFATSMEQIFTPAFTDELSDTVMQDDGLNALNKTIISWN